MIVLEEAQLSQHFESQDSKQVCALDSLGEFLSRTPVAKRQGL
jgi:hypothetical protein